MVCFAEPFSPISGRVESIAFSQAFGDSEYSPKLRESFDTLFNSQQVAVFLSQMPVQIERIADFNRHFAIARALITKGGNILVENMNLCSIRIKSFMRSPVMVGFQKGSQTESG